MELPIEDIRFLAVTGGVTLVTQTSLNKLQITSLGHPLLILLAAPGLSLGACFYLDVAGAKWQLEGLFAFVASYYVLFYTVLSASVMGYRLSPLHPMYRFPGPRIARISKFWAMWVSSTGRQHAIFKELHEKYGTFVRTGPNELSISDPNAIPAVLGAGGLPRGRFYEVHSDPNAPKNLVVLKGDEHFNRRRLWKRGLGKEALAEYSSVIADRVNQFLDRVAEVPGPVDLVPWFGYFSFDCMGDIMFGGGFNMLQAGDDVGGMWSLIEGYFYAASLFCHVPWIVRPLSHVPMVAKRFNELRQFGASFAERRVKKGTVKKDLWYHLIDEAGLEKVPPAMENVVSDGALAIIAGADTSARSLMALSFFLFTNSVYLERVRAEIDSVFGDGGDVLDTTKYDRLVFMDACIKEALRLLPPVPVGGRRRVPEGTGGRDICGRFVPEGTEIYIPPYVVHRDPRNFSPRTEEFWPDRWLRESSSTQDDDVYSKSEHSRSHSPSKSGSDPSFILNILAFVPFSQGPAICVGRDLARLETKMLVCLLLRRYDVRVTDDFDKGKWLSSFREYFVMRATKPLSVTFHARDGK